MIGPKANETKQISRHLGDEALPYPLRFLDAQRGYNVWSVGQSRSGLVRSGQGRLGEWAWIRLCLIHGCYYHLDQTFLIWDDGHRKRPERITKPGSRVYVEPLCRACRVAHHILGEYGSPQTSPLLRPVSLSFVSLYVHKYPFRKRGEKKKRVSCFPGAHVVL